MGRLSGKVALVTGASSGIGWSTADLMAREGATVYAADIMEPKRPHQRKSITHLSLDVRREEAWAIAVDQILDGHGRIDILVNNAGVGGTLLPIHEETLESWNNLLEINQTGVFLGIRAVLSAMRAQKSGSIVNISSVWGIVAAPLAVAYQASKGAVRQLSKNAAVTYAADGIRINSLHPGMVRTPATAGDQWHEPQPNIFNQAPIGRMADPQEIAQGILFLASDESSYMTGAELVIDGGFSAL